MFDQFMARNEDKTKIYNEFKKDYISSSPDIRELFNVTIPFISDGHSVWFYLMSGMAYNLQPNFSLSYQQKDYIDKFDMKEGFRPVESVVVADYGKLSIIYGHNNK